MCATLPLAPPSPQVWYQTAGAEWRRVLWLWQSCVNIRSSWTTRRVRADKCFIRVSRQPRRVFQLGERPHPPPPPDLYVCTYLRWKRSGLLMLPLSACETWLRLRGKKRLQRGVQFPSVWKTFLVKHRGKEYYALLYLIYPTIYLQIVSLKSNFQEFSQLNSWEKKEKSWKRSLDAEGLLKADGGQIQKQTY